VDLNAYWQEHKRFLIALGAGAGLFLIAWMAIAAFFGDELTLLRRRQKSLQADLTQPLHSSSVLAALQADNEALERVFAELSGVVSSRRARTSPCAPATPPAAATSAWPATCATT